MSLRNSYGSKWEILIATNWPAFLWIAGRFGVLRYGKAAH